MADQRKGSIIQPTDYKKFNERGKGAQANSSSDQESLEDDYNSASRDTSGGSEVVINHDKTIQQSYTDTERDNTKSSVENDEEGQESSDSKQTTHQTLRRSRRIATPHRQYEHGEHGHNKHGSRLAMLGSRPKHDKHDIHTIGTQDYRTVTNTKANTHSLNNDSDALAPTHTQSSKASNVNNARLRKTKDKTTSSQMSEHESEMNSANDSTNSEIARNLNHDNCRERNHDPDYQDNNIIHITDKQNGRPHHKKRHTSMIQSEEQDELDLNVDRNEDDLDLDTQRSKSKNSRSESKGNNITMTPTLTALGGARPKSPTKRGGTNLIDTPRKSKQTVAARLLKLPSPIVSPTKSTRRRKQTKTSSFIPKLDDDELYIIESRKADQELENARRMLLHSEREAELATRRLEAEKIRKKILTNPKTGKLTNKKADTENARYVRQRQQVQCVNPESNTQINTQHVQRVEYPEHEVQHIRDDVIRQQTISKEKTKAKNLNPLRRARHTYTGIDGSNNPNMQGQDNGANAWMDAQLNSQELDDEIRLQTTYAKRNSDRNMCFDIDDIPIHGPPHISNNDDDIESVISITEATHTANELLNDNNLFICRNTGMMVRKNDSTDNSKARKPHKRQPTSTVTKVHHYEEKHQHPRYSRRERDRERSYHDHNRYEHVQREGWDSATDSSDESENTTRKRTQSKIKTMQSTSPIITNNNYRFDGPGTSKRGYDDRARSRDNREYGRRYNEESSWPRSTKQKGRANYSSSESDNVGNTNNPKKIKSGINAKANFDVIEQKKYPQFSLGLISGFVGKDIPFDNLTYEQFMAGELTTIVNCTDEIEVNGRTQILQRVAL